MFEWRYNGKVRLFDRAQLCTNRHVRVSICLNVFMWANMLLQQSVFVRMRARVEFIFFSFLLFNFFKFSLAFLLSLNIYIFLHFLNSFQSILRLFSNYLTYNVFFLFVDVGKTSSFVFLSHFLRLHFYSFFHFVPFLIFFFFTNLSNFFFLFCPFFYLIFSVVNVRAILFKRIAILGKKN